jgi:hypothetical protein
MTANTGERDEHTNAANAHLPEGPGDIPADTFAARLVLARHHAGRLSIETAADRCGLNSENWRRWEGGAQPRDKVEVGHAIATGLDMNLNWLLFGGALLSARGKSTKRPSRDTDGYRLPPVRPTVTRSNGRPVPGSPALSVRRPRLIDRSQPVAA